MVLWNHGQLLIKEVLEAVVIRANHKRMAPKIWSPMPGNLNQSNQFALIGGQLGMAWHDGFAEEGNGPYALVQHGTKAGARGITFHKERLGEIWHM